MKWLLVIGLVFLLVAWFRKLDRRVIAWSHYQSDPHIRLLGELERADGAFITYTKTLLSLFLIGTIIVTCYL